MPSKPERILALGQSGMSVADIAAAIGVSRQSVYYHLPAEFRRRRKKIARSGDAQPGCSQT